MRNVMVTIVCVALLAGCAMEEKALSLSYTINIFEEHGVQLTEVEVEDIHPDDAFNHTLNGVAPDIFSVNDDDHQRLSMYVYSSSEEVASGIEDFERRTATITLEAHEIYVVHNVLIFYVYGYGANPIAEMESVISELHSLN